MKIGERGEILYSGKEEMYWRNELEGGEEIIQKVKTSKRKVKFEKGNGDGVKKKRWEEVRGDEQ